MKNILSFVLCALLCGCSSRGPSPDAVKEKAAETTAEVKQDAKAVAEGVREGWTRGNAIDLNSASREQLQTLPGITPKISESIVAHRPYSAASELVDRHVLSKEAYDKIADRVEAKH
jgi:DNA uptake protein ComE-like DNA-binding protein